MDSGWSWMVLLGAFISYFIADGWAYSFGVLFPEMTEHFDKSKGNAALVPTLVYGIPMIISPIVCAVTTVAGFRKVALFGGLLTSVSLVLAAYSGLFSLFCLSIGLLASIGFAAVYVPSIVAVTCHFEKRRGLATGLAVTGSGLGSFAFPPVMGVLMEVYAWRGMLLIVGGICLELLVAGALYRPVEEAEDVKRGNTQKACQEHSLEERRHKSEPDAFGVPARNSDDQTGDRRTDRRHSNVIELIDQSSSEIVPNVVDTNAAHTSSRPSSSLTPKSGSLNNSLHHRSVSVSSSRCCINVSNVFWRELRLMLSAMLDKSVISDGPFLFFCGVNFVIFLWVSVPYVYLVDQAIILNTDKDKANFLMSTVGIARTVGQILIGIVGDLSCVSTNFLYGISIAVIGLATVLVPVCTSYALLTVYAVAFGFCVSVTYVLPMMCLVEIITLQKATNAFGLLQFVQGLSTLIGTPIVGFVFDISGNYNVSFFIAGAWLLVSGLVLCPMPLILRHVRRNVPLL